MRKLWLIMPCCTQVIRTHDFVFPYFTSGCYVLPFLFESSLVILFICDSFHKCFPASTQGQILWKLLWVWKVIVSALGEVPSEWGDKRTPSEKDMGPTRPGAYGSWWKLLSSLNNQVWRSPHVQGGRLHLISTRQQPSSCTPHGCLPR